MCTVGGTLAQDKSKADIPKGVLPKGADGKPLNLDFETGDLQRLDGDGRGLRGAAGQRRYRLRPPQGHDAANMPANFWVGTYERTGDPPQGTLTSAPFKVTHRFAAFLIGGGSTDATRVELVRKENNRVFYKTSGEIKTKTCTASSSI